MKICKKAAALVCILLASMLLCMSAFASSYNQKWSTWRHNNDELIYTASDIEATYNNTNRTYTLTCQPSINYAVTFVSGGDAGKVVPVKVVTWWEFSAPTGWVVLSGTQATQNVVVNGYGATGISPATCTIGYDYRAVPIRCRVNIYPSQCWDFISAAYLASLGRPVDTAGMMAWETKINNATLVKDISDALRSQNSNAPGVDNYISAMFVATIMGTAERYIGSNYISPLGGYTGQSYNGKPLYGYARTEATRRQIIIDLYEFMFGRTPSTDEVNGWLPQMTEFEKDGSQDSHVLSSINGSGECYLAFPSSITKMANIFSAESECSRYTKSRYPNVEASDPNGRGPWLRTFDGQNYKYADAIEITTNTFNWPIVWLDVNGRMDGVDYGSTSGYGKWNIDINGSRGGTGIEDYCKYQYVGTPYSISGITAYDGRQYDGVCDGGTASGYVGKDGTWVRLQFSSKTYTITFDDKGGTGGCGKAYPVYMHWGSNYNGSGGADNLGKVPTKAGYTFDGYYDYAGNKIYSSNGWVSYSDASSWLWRKIDRDGMTGAATWVYADNVTLYAHWIPMKYNVTVQGVRYHRYTDESGVQHDWQWDIGKKTWTINYGEYFNISSHQNEFTTPIGYHYGGATTDDWWTTDPYKYHGGSTDFNIGSSDVVGQLHYYPNNYTMDYNPDFNKYETARVASLDLKIVSEHGEVLYTGTGLSDYCDSIGTYGCTYYFTNVKYKTGYGYNGYHLSSTGLDETAASTGSVTVGENGTAFTFKHTAAGTMWFAIETKPMTYTIHFDGNGATDGSMSDQTVQYGTDTALAVNVYTQTGYTFTGWNTAADGSGAAYADQATIKDLAEPGTTATLYAQWKVRNVMTAKVVNLTVESSRRDSNRFTKTEYGNISITLRGEITKVEITYPDALVSCAEPEDLLAPVTLTVGSGIADDGASGKAEFFIPVNFNDELTATVTITATYADGEVITQTPTLIVKPIPENTSLFHTRLL